jgi:hypothetical protein
VSRLSEGRVVKESASHASGASAIKSSAAIGVTSGESKASPNAHSNLAISAASGVLL